MQDAKPSIGGGLPGYQLAFADPLFSETLNVSRL